MSDTDGETIRSSIPTRPKDTPEREHLLLTVLGTKPREALYTFDGRKERAQLAPVALLKLLAPADRPNRILAICTPEAEGDSWQLLKVALDDQYTVEAVKVPSGETQDVVNDCLAKVTAGIPADVDLTVDITHGLRHHSFLTYVAVLYLAALRGVRVRGAYYGMFKGKDQDSPFFDLRPLLELPNWIYAIQVLRDTGSALPLADALHAGAGTPVSRDIAGRLEARDGLLRSEPDSLSAGDFAARDLLLLSEAHLSGLPLELGYRAHTILQRERSSENGTGSEQFNRVWSLKTLWKDLHMPMADELVDRFKEILEPFELKQRSHMCSWKSEVQLDQDELTRQARIIDYHLQRLNFSIALGLMQEWTVSWVAWWSKRRGNWLNYHAVRKPVEEKLDGFEQNDPNTKEHKLGEFWRKLKSLRNGTHHHGMRENVLVGSEKILGEMGTVLGFWNETLRSCPDFSRSPSQRGEKR